MFRDILADLKKILIYFPPLVFLTFFGQSFQNPKYPSSFRQSYLPHYSSFTIHWSEGPPISVSPTLTEDACVKWGNQNKHFCSRVSAATYFLVGPEIFWTGPQNWFHSKAIYQNAEKEELLWPHPSILNLWWTYPNVFVHVCQVQKT